MTPEQIQRLIDLALQGLTIAGIPALTWLGLQLRKQTKAATAAAQEAAYRATEVKAGQVAAAAAQNAASAEQDAAVEQTSTATRELVDLVKKIALEHDKRLEKLEGDRQGQHAADPATDPEPPAAAAPAPVWTSALQITRRRS